MFSRQLLSTTVPSLVYCLHRNATQSDTLKKEGVGVFSRGPTPCLPADDSREQSAFVELLKLSPSKGRGGVLS